MKLSILGFFSLLCGLGVAQDANSLLWEVTGKGLKAPSYVYGTMHVKDKKAFVFNDSVLPKIKATETFAVEIIQDEMGDKSQLQKSLMLPNGQTLSDVLTKKEYKTLKKALDKKGLNIEQFKTMKPMFISTLLSVKEGGFKDDYSLSVDEYLLAYARQNNKTCIGIETVQEQLSAIDKIPHSEAIKALKQSPKKSEKSMQQLLDAYSKQDLAKLGKLYNPKKSSAEFNSSLIETRNVNMANRMEARMKDKSIFMAVGALHLPNDNGVLQLLKNKGYTVKPIMAGHTIPVEDIKPTKAQPTATTAIEGGNTYNGPDIKITFPLAYQEKNVATGVSVLMAMDETTQSVYLVNVADKATDKTNEQLMAELKDNLTKKLPGSKLQQEKDITSGAYKGKHFVVTTNMMGQDITMDALVFFTEKKAISVMAQAIGASTDTTTKEAFFNSLHIK